MPREKLDDLIRGAGRGDATAFIALYGDDGDVLAATLRAWDAAPRLQTQAAAYLTKAGPPVYGNVTSHVSEKGPAAAFDVALSRASGRVLGGRRGEAPP